VGISGTYAAGVSSAEPAPVAARFPTTRQAVAHTVAGAVAVGATFLSWLQSGSRGRSSYDLLGVIDRLDVAPDGVIAHLVEWWPLVPLLITVAVVAGWWRRPVVAAVVSVAAGLYVAGVAGALLTARRRIGIELGAGPYIALAGVAGFVGVAAWWSSSLVRVRRRSRRLAAAAPPSAPAVDPS
jgi:hypothetical protein